MLSILGERHSYLCTGLFAVLSVLVCGIAASAADAPSPLQYVRSVIVPPAVEICPALAPLPSARPGAHATAVAREAESARQAARTLARNRFVLLRSQAAASLSSELLSAIGRLRGISVRPATASGFVLVTREASGELAVNDAAASASARGAAADAAIVCAMDRFGVRTLLDRAVWMRAVGWIVSSTGSVAGPFHAVGEARASRIFFRPGFTRTDAQLEQEAASQAARSLVSALDTGREAPFSDDTRVAIVPAVTPDSVSCEVENGTPEVVPLPALVRQRDVLLQPSLPPIVVRADTAEVEDALAGLGKTPASLWSGDTPDSAAVCTLAARLGVQYVFLSRVTRLMLTEEPVQVPDGDTMRTGVERRAEAEAEAALVRASDGRVLWRDTLEARTASRTAYARGRARITTPDKCVIDAVHAAYGYLRLSFDEYRRRGSP